MTTEQPPTYAVEQKDKRSNLRVPLIVERLPCGDGRRTFFGYARNISRGGLFIATVSPRPPGEQFDLQVTLPAAGETVLRCRCEVVWQRPYTRDARYEPGMGLRFLDLSEESGAALERWLNSLSPR